MEEEKKLNKEAERIQKDYLKFRELCSQTGDRASKILSMIDNLEDRIIECPASSKVDFHLAKTGGLINHSLRCLNFLIKLTKTFEISFPKESLIISALWHDGGKLGSPEAPYYLPETEDWRYRRGYRYKINQNIQFMTLGQRSVFLFQYFGIPLKEDEYLSLLLNDGLSLPENQPYKFKQPKLSILLNMADEWSCQVEKDNGL